MIILRAIALLASSFIALAGLWSCVPPLSVTISSPSTGDFMNTPTATVTGSINKTATGHTLEVNGVAVPLNPDGTWSTSVTLDTTAVFNTIVATATTTASGATASALITVAAGDSVADGAFSPESVALRINDSGLDSIEPVVGGLVDLDLANLVPVGTVIVDDCFIDGGFLGCLGSAVVSVTNPPPKIDSFDIAFDSMTNTVDAAVDLVGLEINVFLDGSGLVPNCDLRITATGTNIDGTYTLEPMAPDGAEVDVTQSGSVSVSFTGFNEEFTSGICDFPVLGDIIQALLPNVESLTTSGVSTFLNTVDANGNTPIAGAVETALAGINITGPIGSALGADLQAPLFAVTEDVDGLTLGSDVSFTSDCTPPAGAPDLTESLALTEPFPTFGPTTPGSGTPYGIGICISTAGLNQLLKAQTECGLLLTSITELDLGGGPQPLTAGLLALFIPELGIYDPATPIRIDIIPVMAPIFSGESGPGGELAELRIGHLKIELRFDNANNALLIEGAVNARIGTDITVDTVNNTLNFVLAPPNPTDINVFITRNIINTNEAALLGILPPLIALLLPDLASSLASFPVPTFLDLNLSVVEIEQNGEFTSIFADLVAP